MISDRWAGYNHLNPERRQACWSHLQRDFRRHAEGLAEQQTFGEQGLELTGRLFAAWRRYQHEHHDRAQLKTEIDKIEAQLRVLVEHAARKSKRTRLHRRRRPDRHQIGLSDGGRDAFGINEKVVLGARPCTNPPAIGPSGGRS